MSAVLSPGEWRVSTADSASFIRDPFKPLFPADGFVDSELGLPQSTRWRPQAGLQHLSMTDMLAAIDSKRDVAERDVLFDFASSPLEGDELLRIRLENHRVARLSRDDETRGEFLESVSAERVEDVDQLEVDHVFRQLDSWLTK